MQAKLTIQHEGGVSAHTEGIACKMSGATEMSGILNFDVCKTHTGRSTGFPVPPTSDSSTSAQARSNERERQERVQ